MSLTWQEVAEEFLSNLAFTWSLEPKELWTEVKYMAEANLEEINNVREG